MSAQQKKGIFPQRICTQEERNYISSLYAQAEQKLLQDNSDKAHINWRNIYIEGTHYLFKDRPEEQLQFERFIKNFLQDIIPDQKLEITSAGFLFNPNGSKEYQHFHFDFCDEQCGIFVPLVHLNSQNCTQFVTFTSKNEPYNIAHFGSNELDLLERQGLDFYEVRQVVCKPYTILKMEAGTIHRGIPNQSGYDRAMFWVHAAPQKIGLLQREFENAAIFLDEQQ